MQNFSVFSYKQGTSLFHKMPSWIKILLIPLFNIFLFMSDWKISVCCIVLFIILFCILKFSLREQFKDLKPVFFYGIFLYVMKFFIQFYTFYSVSSVSIFLTIRESFFYVVCDKETAFYCAKFCACVQSCSLMFKTSTSLEIREGIEKIELFIRKFLPCSKKAKFALAISMLINFIPTVFKLWSQLKRAYHARGGKNGIKMVRVIIPQLFSLGLRFAFNTTKAFINRGE